MRVLPLAATLFIAATGLTLAAEPMDAPGPVYSRAATKARPFLLSAIRTSAGACPAAPLKMSLRLDRSFAAKKRICLPPAETIASCPDDPLMSFAWSGTDYSTRFFSIAASLD